LVEVHRQAARNGLAVERIIVAPEYVGRILATKGAPGIARLESSFMRTPAWVRHDEHIHLDFRVASSARRE
jgi:penicillin-insensitive murein DD-endopeptidase